MFSPEAREIIKDVLELFAQASELPIAIYEMSADGNVTEVVRSGDNNYPLHCKTVWQIGGGLGRELCHEDMCSRAKVGFSSLQQESHLCHAGLSVRTDPIIIKGKVIAVIEYGAYVVQDESDPGRRLALHERAMGRLNATKRQASTIRKLLLEDAPGGDKEEWKWFHRALPPIIARLIDKYISHDQREKRIQRMAYHDLQLRLQAALSLAENMRRHIKRERGTDQKRVDEVEDVAGAIEAAGTVLHNLSRGQYLPERYIFSFQAIERFIDDALMLCRPQAREKEIEIEINLEPEGSRIKIHASELHLQQAFNNLLQNAVKYSYRRPVLKTGEVTRPRRFISVRGQFWQERSELGYRVSIGNYGVGVEPDELDQIFSEGYQGKLTRAEYRTGSGHGLALTKRIIQQHGGTITVNSTPRGDPGEDGTRPYYTRFDVWFPLKQHS